MTKAKARARAKARAAAKAAGIPPKGGKPGDDAAKPAAKTAPGNHIDVKSLTKPKVGAGADVKTLAAMKRGSARSR